MACKECDGEKMVAYVRVDEANVGLIGCNRHLQWILEALDRARKENWQVRDVATREVYRVKV